MDQPPAGAWHPDPYGRAHSRWWDGAAWTDRAATWGHEWTDLPGSRPGDADLTILAEPRVAFAYGAAGGIEALGRWGVYDPSGRHRGWVVAEGFGGVIPGMYISRRYLLLDPSDRILLRLEPRKGFTGGDLELIDWTGRPHGLFDARNFTDLIQLRVGNQVMGQARARDGAGRAAPIVSNDIDHFAVSIFDYGGTDVATVVNHEARRGLGSFFGGGPVPGELQPHQSWLQLDRRPDLPEPLRTFVMAFPMAYANRVHNARQARRNSTY